MHFWHKQIMTNMSREKKKKTKLLLVDQIVGGGLVKGVVKLEYLMVQVLGEIHLLLWLMNKQRTVSWHRHHIDFLSVGLWKTPTSAAILLAIFLLPVTSVLSVRTYPACSAAASEHTHRSYGIQSIQVKNK